ncbi:Poly-gamma-glutamate capsule biosynthesis protein CapA [uncultured virus]|nr:Poly-gamma-glutamate capsule biosynthesis protein CapA [uncultured virus]
MRIVLQGGDNMLGRAVQLTLPYQTPGDNEITDTQSAQAYLNDILPNADIESIRNQNRDGSYLWNDLLSLDFSEDVRILNLEAAPTFTINNPDLPNKEIHYHVNINNLPGLFSRFTRPYVLSMANNHTMDLGSIAFTQETLPFLSNTVGIGSNITKAQSAKIIGNVAIFAFGAGCSGVPINWAATENNPGLAYIPPINNLNAVNSAIDIMRFSLLSVKDKCKVVSIHWGPNWSHENDEQKYRELLAHRLIDELGVSLIYGHSSHHIRGIELYKNHLIIYGAGDFVNDYEAIPVHDNYNTTGAIYVIDLDYTTYNLVNLQFIPFQMKRLQCQLINDTEAIRKLIGFVNKQSIKDSDYPMILQI